MRVKTEEKRQEIVAIAIEVFRQRGYASTSISEISSRLGGSKSTLYNYFESKEELFVSAMKEMARRAANPLIEELEHADDLRQGLKNFIYKSMLLLCTPEMTDFRRMVIGEASKTQIGKLMYAQGGKNYLEAFADFYSAKMREGYFRKEDPWQAAVHMYALCYGPPVQLVLEGIIDLPPDEDFMSSARSAADFFLRGYATKLVPME
jgi:AcrR family transcriptional regulator